MYQISVGVLGLLAAGAIYGQAPDNRVAYEAASVKLDTTGSPHSGTDGAKGQIMMTNLPLRRLIERAYNVKPTQVAGPDWLDSVRVDIAAKYPPDTKAGDRPLMLRTLLQDRFKLAVHNETRELPGYALVVAKNGFKLKPVEGEDNDTEHHGGRIHTLSAKGTSMAELADLLSLFLNAIVVDKTGIGGVYHFDLRWAREEPNADRAEDVPTLPMAVQDTLGLRLEAQRIPVAVVVVDRMERVPTEN